jgi:hypothetical protein
MVGVKMNNEIQEVLALQFSARKPELYYLEDISFHALSEELLHAVQIVFPDAKNIGEETNYPVSIAMAIPNNVPGKSIAVQAEKIDEVGEVWILEQYSGEIRLKLIVGLPKYWEFDSEKLKNVLTQCLKNISMWYTIR